MKKSDLLIILIFSFLLITPIFLNISSTFPRLDTDYDSSLPIYSYMVSFFWKYHSLPLVIPFVARGIPVLGDPLNSFLNPLLSVPLLLFGINTGIRIVIFLNILLSGLTIYFLLQSVRLKRVVKLFGSLLYMSSGALIAQIAAGHIEKFLIYPLVPLLLLLSLKRSFSLKVSVFCSLVIAATVYSGDLYATWFFFLFFIVIRSYYFFTVKRFDQITFPLLVFPLSILFSFPKLYPFVVSVLPTMQRYFPIDPYQGSVQLFLLPLFFIVPFKVSFYDRPFFQHHLGFSFNWYEYYAFLSPLPFIFLWNFKKIWKIENVRILFLLITTSALYVSLGFPYSPFFWIFHIFSGILPFRVPQRIVLPLVCAVVFLLSYSASIWLNEKNTRIKFIFLIFSFTLLWTTFIFWQTLEITFPLKLVQQPKIINDFSKIYKKNETVVTFAPQTQFFLTEKGISIANYYYGWVPKGTETYIKGNTYDFVRLLNEKPEFVLTGVYTSLIPYGYTNVLKNATIAVWKRG